MKRIYFAGVIGVILTSLASPQLLALAVPKGKEIPAEPKAEALMPSLDGVIFSPVDTKTASMPAARRPSGILVEAEYPKPPGQNVAVDVPDASGGQAVTSSVIWEPLFQAAIPGSDDAFTLWLRHKGGPLYVKSVFEEQQQELKVLESISTDWTWTNVGRYTRQQLRSKLLIIRGAQSEAPAPLIDAVVFAPNEGAADTEPLGLGKVARVLPSDQSDETKPPQIVQVNVDWNKRVGIMPAAMWGANDYEALTPEHANDAVYQKQLADLKLPWVRLHQAAISDTWTNSTTRDWNIPKIKAGLKASTGFGDARLMINLASWPTWLHPDGEVLPEAKEDEFVALCGQLAHIMRQDVKHPVAYYEIINEKEFVYSGADKLPDLWRLFNKVADAIHRADPSARIGGPAFAFAKAEWVDDFLKNCGHNIQFISWHRYASNDIYEPSESVLAQPEEMARTVKQVRASLKTYVPTRTVEMLLTEFNIQAVWQPFERRHSNAIGAVFDASVLRQMALAGLDGSAVWHLKGDAYGLIDAQNKPRPGYFLYRWGTRYLTGNIASSSSDSKNVEVVPVSSKNGRQALLVINKMAGRASLPSATKLMATKKSIHLKQIHGESESTSIQLSTSQENAALSLPGYSLTLIHN